MHDAGIIVAVVGPDDIYRRGTIAVLRSAGYRVEEPTDEIGWAVGLTPTQPAAAIVFLTPATGCGPVLRLRAANPSLAIIVVLVMDAFPSTARCVEVLRAGAGGVLAGDLDAAALLAGLSSVLHGLAVLPLSTTSRALVATVVPQPCMVTDAELELLRQLSTGVTMTKLASGARCSERQVYRRLSRICGRLGVASPVGAVLEANRRGYL